MVYPFTETEFLEMWKTWLQERRDRRYKNYTDNGEQATAQPKKMSNDDYESQSQSSSKALPKAGRTL